MGLSKAYTILADMHNKLEITRPMKTKVSKFHSRKFSVIRSDAFAKEILSSIKNREIKQVRPYFWRILLRIFENSVRTKNSLYL